MSEILRYDNGLKVGVETIPSLRSVSVGYWAGVGSSKELPEINGLSHFTEHMMFKGTSKLSPFQIARRFDEMGTISNAFTGKEMTCYYIKTIDDYVEPSFELLSDLVFDSAFPGRNGSSKTCRSAADDDDLIAFHLLQTYPFLFPAESLTAMPHSLNFTGNLY